MLPGGTCPRRATAIEVGSRLLPTRPTDCWTTSVTRLCKRRLRSWQSPQAPRRLELGLGAERTGVQRHLGHLSGLGIGVSPRAASVARNAGLVITAAWPMPLIASRLSRIPTVCRPRHLPSAKTRAVIWRCRVTVGVACPGGEVADETRLDLLHNHLHLPSPGPTRVVAWEAIRMATPLPSAR